jgi:hypothetical protein
VSKFEVGYLTMLGSLMNMKQLLEWKRQRKLKYPEKTCPPVPLCPPQIPHDETWEAGDGTRDMAFFLEFRNVYILLLDAMLGETKKKQRNRV